MWNIKLGAEDLLDLDPALEGGQWEEVWKEPEPDQMEPFLDPCFFILLMCCWIQKTSISCLVTPLSNSLNCTYF